MLKIVEAEIENQLWVLHPDEKDIRPESKAKARKNITKLLVEAGITTESMLEKLSDSEFYWYAFKVTE